MYINFLTPETLQMIYQLTLAAFLGMLVGLEREYHGKPAGLRTYMLVTVGAALFTIMSVKSALGVPYFDPSRIASQVVVGIGFIGGGLILVRGGRVEGLTTAAGLWATAAIGMAAGFGFYAIAIYTTVLVLFVLWVLRFLENYIHHGELSKKDDNDEPL